MLSDKPNKKTPDPAPDPSTKKRYSSPTAVKTFSQKPRPIPQKQRPIPQKPRSIPKPIRHSTPISSKFVRPVGAVTTEFKLGPKPIVPKKSVKAVNDKVVKPMKKEPPRVVETVDHDCDVDSKLEEEDDVGSICSDISSILSFDSSSFTDNHFLTSPENLSLAHHGLTPTRHSLTPDPTRHSLTPPLPGRLHKSKSTQHTNTFITQLRKSNTREVSPHLKYGIFSGKVKRPGGGLKKCVSSVSVSGVSVSGVSVGGRGLVRTASSGANQLSVTCQKLHKQNENLQKCLTISQDRVIKKITQLKDTTNEIVDERRELVSSLQEKDDRISSLKDQLHNISAVGFSDTESMMSEASEYNDALTDNLRRRNGKLKDKVRRLEDVLAKCKTTIQNGIDTTNELSREKEALQDKIEKLEFEQEEHRSRDSHVTSSRDSHVTSSRELLVDVGHGRGPGGAATPTNISLEEANKIQSLESEVVRLKEEEDMRSQEIFQLVTEIERIKQENLQLHDQIKSKTGELFNLTKSLSETRSELSTHQSRISQLHIDLTAADSRYDTLKTESESETSSLGQQIERLEKEKEKLSVTLHEIDVNKAMELQDVRSEAAGQVNLLNNKVTALKQELDTANRALGVLKDRDSSLEDLLEELGGIRGELERVSGENMELRHQVDKDRAGRAKEVGDLQGKYETEVQEKEQLASELRRLERDCEMLSSEISLLGEERRTEKAEWELKFQQQNDNRIGERERLEETHLSQITPFKKKIKEMQEQIHKLKEDKEEQEQEISDLTRHVFESNSDCAQLNNEVTELHKKLQTSEKSATILQDQLKSKTTECIDLEDTLGTTNDNLTSSHLLVVDLKCQIETLSKETTKKTSEIESLEGKVEELNSQKLGTEKEIKTLKARLCDDDEEHQMKVSQLQEAINSVVTDRDGKIRNLKLLQEQYTQLEQTLNSKLNGTEILSEQNRLLQDKLNELQNTITILTTQINSLTEDNKSLQNNETKLRGDLENVKEDQQRVIDDLNSIITELKQALEVLENEKCQKNDRVEELMEEKGGLIHQFDEDRKRLEAENEAINKILEEVRLSLVSKEEDLSSLSQQNTEHLSQMEKMKKKISKLEESKETAGSLSETVKELETELEIKIKTISKLEGDMITKTAEFTSRFGGLEKDLDSSSTACELLRKQCQKYEEEVNSLEERRHSELSEISSKREADLQMYADQYQDELKKQDGLQVEVEGLRKSVDEVEEKLRNEVDNHLKAKEGLAKASQAIGKLRGFVKEQENKIENLTKLKNELETKSSDAADLHNSSLSEVQLSYMAKLEQAAERENKLKLELKSLNRDRESERDDLESRVRKLVEEKKQLGDIMKEKMEENRWLGEQVEQNKKEVENNQTSSAEHEARLGQLSNHVKQLQNDLEHLTGLENDLKVLLHEHTPTKDHDNQLPDNDNKLTDKSPVSLIKDIISNLDKGLREKEGEVRSVVEQRNQFKAKLVELKRKAEAKIAELVEGKNKLEELNSELKQNLTESETKFNDLTEKLNLLETDKQNLVNKSETEKEQITERFEAELKSSQTSVNDKSSQVSELTEELNLKTNKIVDLETQLSQLNSKGTENSSVVESLGRELEETKKMFGEMTDKSSQLTRDKDEISAARDGIQNELVALKEEFSTLSEQCSVLIEQNSALKGQNSVFSEQQSDASSRIAELETLKQELADKIQILVTELKQKTESQAETQARCSELEQQLLEQQKLVESQDNIFAEQEINMENKTDKIKQLESTCSDLKSKLDSIIAQETQSQEHKSKLEQEISVLKEELETARGYLEKQENVQSEAMEAEEELRGELGLRNKKLKEREIEISKLNEMISALKKELSSRTTTCDELTTKTSTLTQKMTSLHDQVTSLTETVTSRDEDMVSLKQENSRVVSHSRSIEVCFSSLKEDNSRLEQALNQNVSEKESLTRAHKVELHELRASLEKEHAENMTQLNSAMERKIRKATEEEDTIARLQTQIKKLENTVTSSKTEVERVQAKCSVTVSDYSSKFLLSEKKCVALGEQLNEQNEQLKYREKEILQLKSDTSSQIAQIKKGTLDKAEHEEIVFNLEMAYNMNLQETTEKLELRIKELETHLGGDILPSKRNSNDNLEDLKRHLDNLTRRHKIEIETLKNEAIFNANQEYELKLKHWQEASEQRHLGEINKLMEENSKDRQRLLREVEIKERSVSKEQPTLEKLNFLNNSAGRISVSSETSETYLLETEYEYLKGILYRYLKGEHTNQLLKVILAILRYSETEKHEILGLAR